MTGISLSNELQLETLISAFEYTMPSDFSYAGESHSSWEFVFVNRGKVRITADKMTYILKSGEMVCHKPLEFHCVIPYQGDAVITVLCFTCSSDKMAYFNNKILTIPPHRRQYIYDISEHAKRVFLPKNPLMIARDGQMDKRADSDSASEQFIKNTIELLILSLMRAESTDRRKRSEFYEMTTRRLTLTEDIKKYISENFTQNISIDELSEKFSYSPSSLKRIFKEETGYSLIDYRNQLRVTEAQSMLAKTNIPIGDIAQKLGYSSTYYFSNVIKKATGLSPVAYRKAHLS